ncbi:MBL fold metallo-hydrolase [Amycolatopsis cihanbeyliensis]|uniref:L-ascorbate metabolism protein UlaG (Beta-lactamase superfamily) n=1 Tax=Amycolatopsis cihanbeyliensis TaxID=1128664 RepID=A0A542DQW9_AMYCI|nr:MBL fold metallo-hydrolase [Amycolatopsis cihanbeyliensis]TQJ05502.1 L-ascorbate metabolism protein UlaG (beta-lactamase superfamily) [Amycolatopsis cihanbeyliensis]
MRIRRLGWSGLEIEAGDETAVVDLIEDTTPLLSVRDLEGQFPPVSRPGNARLALVTHLHADHADPAAIAAAVRADATVLRPPPARGGEEEVVWTARAESGFTEQRLTSRVVGDWERHRSGPFEVTAVPAVDGLGDPQVNWVIEAEGTRIFHGGDTMFHGMWWLIAARYGPFDAAFLPINGAVVDFPHLQPPSPLAAAMDPRQAAVAARILGAHRAVPIHYRALHMPPRYVEVDDPEETFQRHTAELGVTSVILPPGEWLELAGEPA